MVLTARRRVRRVLGLIVSGLLPPYLTGCVVPVKNHPPKILFGQAGFLYDSTMMDYRWSIKADADDRDGQDDIVEFWADFYEYESTRWVESFRLEWVDSFHWERQELQHDTLLNASSELYLVRFVAYDLQASADSLWVESVLVQE